MNWNQIQGDWKQFSGRIKEKWGKRNDDDHRRKGSQKDRRQTTGC